MAYIGRDIDKISNVEVLDNITFDGSSSYTLQKGGSNFTPSSANTLLVSIDGIVQAGNFTVSGSTINFGTAVSASSTCNFILHYGVGLITAPADGTVTTAKLADSSVTTAKLNDASVSLAKLTATGTKDATTFLRGDNTFASAGGVNTPAFEAIMSGNQSISNGSNTKINFNTKNFDTDSCYDNTTNYRFTPTTAGKYFIYTQLGIFGGGNTTLQYAYTRIYKNGSDYKSAHFDLRANEQAFSTPHTTAIVTLNGSTDYVEVYALAGSTGSPTIYLDYSVFGAYKIIE